MCTIKQDAINKVKGQVIAIVCNAFAGCETLEAIKEAKEIATNRCLNGVKAMQAAEVFTTEEVELIANFSTGYIACVEEKTRERVVEALRDAFEF